MFKKLMLLPMTLLTFAAVSAFGASPLEVYRDQKRVIVLLSDTESHKDRIKSLKAIHRDPGGIRERDIVVLEENDPRGPLHERFKVGRGFTVILIGKDGGVKWTEQETALDLPALFSLIDSMPMRKSESKSRKK